MIRRNEESRVRNSPHDCGRPEGAQTSLPADLPIARAIGEGSLWPGQRIPSTRVLAAELGVSRFPVLSVYDLLLAEGYFESRVGAGTVVSSSLPDLFTSSASASAARLLAAHSVPRPGPRPVAHRCSLLLHREIFPWLLGFGAFAVGQVAFDQFPLQVWSRLVARHCRKMDAKSLHYRRCRRS